MRKDKNGPRLTIRRGDNFAGRDLSRAVIPARRKPESIFAVLLSVTLATIPARMQAGQVLEPANRTAPKPASTAQANLPVSQAAPAPALPVAVPGTDDSRTAKRITLDVRDMDIVDVMKLFGRQSGQSVVIGRNVAGKVTVTLTNALLDDALKAVLRSRELAYVREDGLIRVMIDADYRALTGVSFGTGAATRVFRLDNARADEIAPKIQPYLSREHGAVQADRRTNTLVVTDVPARLDEAARIVAAFDEKDRAVLIEAKMVQVALSDNFQWGVNWEYVFDKINGRDVGGKIIGKLPILPTGTQSASDAATKGVTATIGSIPQNHFTGTLNLLKTVGKTNLVSSPRIMALNNSEARFLVGTKQAYVTTTVVTPGGGGPVTSSEQVSFVDVGVKLFVTPTIGADGFIRMKIRPEISSVDSTLTTPAGNAIPIVRVSEAETSVSVKDGTTVVIGGLIEDARGRSENRIPWIGRIPVIGWFFGSRSRSMAKSELVIFLTPRITAGDVQAPEAATAGAPL